MAILWSFETDLDHYREQARDICPACRQNDHRACEEGFCECDCEAEAAKCSSK